MTSASGSSGSSDSTPASEPNPTPQPTLAAFSDELATAVERAGSAIVAVNASRRCAASGIHWQSGLIVTVDHAIRREESITVTLTAGRTVSASLVGRDGSTDLAVLKLPDTELSIAELSEEPLRVGQLVLGVGRSSEGELAASLGIISSLGGPWRSWHGGRIEQFIRLALTAYSGLTGGALVDTSGRILGMNTSGRRGLTLTIPTSTVRRVVNQLLQSGRVARGYLGVGMQSVQIPERLQQTLNLNQATGVIVVSVEPESPADRAGVLIGDVLVRLGDQAITDVSDVYLLLDPDRVGQPLTAQIVRGGALLDLAITVGERPWRQNEC
ncbi:MAG: trypsin-like peptidase domain-containing protein [Synechococcales cyanobacterium C42_A2020_086]|jgi:S1-C subfamily serine protease|nr:trypsin-like peptidase domain-containing protein [Synechococcales cyanobacterium C42_A2020_086]